MKKMTILLIPLLACGGSGGTVSPDAADPIGSCPDNLSGQYEALIGDKVAGSCDTSRALRLLISVDENATPGFQVVTDQAEESLYMDRKVEGCNLDFAIVYGVGDTDPSRTYVYSLTVDEAQLVGEVTIVNTGQIAICAARYAVTGGLL